METNKRFKLYKSGKLWVVGAVVVAGLAVSANITQVSADTVSNTEAKTDQKTDTTENNNQVQLTASSTDKVTDKTATADETKTDAVASAAGKVAVASTNVTQDQAKDNTVDKTQDTGNNDASTASKSGENITADKTTGADTDSSKTDENLTDLNKQDQAVKDATVKQQVNNATTTEQVNTANQGQADLDKKAVADGVESDSSTKDSTAVVNSTRSLKASSSLPSQISDFKASVTASDGSTMNNGSSFNLTGQSAHLKAINLGFTLTQDGTLTSGSTIKIPVSVVNNASSLVSSALSSGTSLDIQGVGTIQYQSDDRFGTSGNYIITIGDSFDQTVGKQVIATVTEQPSDTSSLVTTDSTQNIVLTIGDNTFTFVPVKRAYEKDTGDYSSNDFAYSPSANTINTGTVIKDPNYVNNMLESNGTDAGDTKIPTGNIINIQRVQTSGSALTSINLGNYLGNSTLQISEDGTYLIKNDNSADYNFKSGTGVASLISLPAGTSDADIVAALNKAGKHSGVVINEGNGQYTIAYNIGNVIGDGAYTYHDLYANDDAATQADKAQEVNRTDEINNQLNQLLSKLNVIQNLGLQSSFKFADSSVTNKLSGTGTQYSVASDGTVTKVTSNDISSNTTPSNARAEGQSKITVHYVDKDGKELSTQAYSYGYPAGSSIAPQSPDYQVAPKDIKGYTLVTSDSPVDSLNGKQLTTSSAVPFLSDDQTVYYVYTKNDPTITTESKTVNETIHYV
ncbi:MucBP domain-containing protein, partial [Leuconostoc falkenbergense]|uniref:MucBP domain-containing protein n=1 Tax=Leuconostoc falkenbergense TaxID=2766470 RepID=UPI0024AE53C1